VPVVQDGGERGRVADPPGHGDRLLAQGGPAVKRRREHQRPRQPRQHPGPQHPVVAAERHQRLLQQPHLRLVDDQRGDLGAQAERGPGQRLGRADAPGQGGGALVAGTGGDDLAGRHLRLAEGQLQLAAARRVGRPQVQRLQRPLELGRRLTVRELLQGPPARQRRVQDRLALPAGGRGLPEVVGQLGQAWLQVGAEPLLDRLPGPPVQRGPAGGRQPLVQHLAQQRVGEPVAGDRARRPLHQARLDRPVEQGELRLGRHAGDGAEQVQAELLPQHGRRRQQVGAAGGQPVKAPPQDLPDALGDGGPILRDQEAGDLPDEQGVRNCSTVDHWLSSNM
jgi:hypothetical protein